MDLLHKIRASRTTLKSQLQSEWDTDIIQDLSIPDLDALYNTKPTKDDLFASLGQGFGCNLTLQNRLVPSHVLHIIYYNFPASGDHPIKVTKTCQDKLAKLYGSGVYGSGSGFIDKDDSLLVILCVPLSETVGLAIEQFYQAGQNELLISGIRDEVLKENDSLEEYLRYPIGYFRGAHIFSIDQLTIDITKHTLVPKHECIRGKPEIKDILETCNATLDQIPIIKRTDPQAKVMRLVPGDLCRIKRPTLAGLVVAYRVCQ